MSLLPLQIASNTPAMTRFTVLSFIFLSLACESGKRVRVENGDVPPVALVVHGGAGTITKENMTPDQEIAYHAALKQALEAGFEVLDKGGKSVDAVIASVAMNSA